MTLFVTETYKRSKDPNRMVKPQPLTPEYQPGGPGHDEHLQTLIEMHPEAIYYSDNPDEDFPGTSPTPLWVDRLADAQTKVVLAEKERNRVLNKALEAGIGAAEVSRILLGVQ